MSSTNRKRAAKKIAAEQHIPYQTALQQVIAAESTTPVAEDEFSEIGTCDECDTTFDIGSRMDHCGECGNCWTHCSCGLSAVSFDGMVKVEWYDAGEGSDGDYDPEDPEDVALYRYDAYVLWDHEDYVKNELRGLELDPFAEDGETWGTRQDSSFCTNTPVETDPATLRRLAQLIANELADALDNGGWKNRAEEMSYAHPDWVK